MSILATSPTATRHFDMNIAAALGDVNAAIILQQLDYWLMKEGVGTVIKGTKYVYNTFVDWVNSQFRWLSVWQFRKAMGLLRSLGIVKVIRYKSRQWNQTNYYSLDRDRLAKFLEQERLESTETVEMCVTASQDERYQTLDLRDSEISIYSSKEYTQKSTAKQDGDLVNSKSNSIAAASPKKTLEEGKGQTEGNPCSERLTAVPGQKKRESEVKQSNPNKEKEFAKVDAAHTRRSSSSTTRTHSRPQVNKELMVLLDSTGIPINKTIKDLLKLYPAEKVEGAIAIVRSRKRDQHIPNLSGYFVAALKGDWRSQNLTVEESEDSEVDKGAVLRHWYDLARELGYCSGQELREGQQWVCLSGSWEKWEKAIARGYSLTYLKKIVKRNSG